MARLLSFPGQLPEPFRAWPQTDEVPCEPGGRFIALTSGPPAVRPWLVLVLLVWWVVPLLAGGVAAIGVQIARAGLLESAAKGLATPGAAVKLALLLACLGGLTWVLVSGATVALWQRRHLQRVGAGLPSPFGLYLGRDYLVSWVPVFWQAPRLVCVRRSQCLGAELSPRRTKHGVYHVPTVVVRADDRRGGVQRVSWPARRFAVADGDLVQAVQDWAAPHRAETDPPQPSTPSPRQSPRAG